MKKNSLIVNYLYNATYSLLNILIPLITIPYVSRILSAAGVGRVSSAQNVLSYFVMISSLGIPNYAIREIAKCCDNKEKISTLFFELFSFNAISTTFATVGYFFFIQHSTAYSDEKILLMIFSATLILNVFNIDWLYRGLENFKYITLRNFLIKILSLICVVAFVKKSTDIYVYAAILAVSTSANYILNAINARKIVSFKEINQFSLKKHVTPIFLMFATAVGVELYGQIDITMLTLMCGNTFVGYYSNSVKLTKMVVTLIAAVGGVLLPRLSGYKAKANQAQINGLVSKVTEYVFFISVPAAIGLMTLSPEIVIILFGKDFLPAISTLRILSLLIPIMTIGNLYGTQVLMTYGKEKNLTISILCGSILNILLNSIMISWWKQDGAALASVLTEFCVMIIQIAMSNVFIKVSLRKKAMFITIIQAFLVVFAVYILRTLCSSSFTVLLMGIVLSVVVFFTFGLFFKNEIQKELVEKILSLLGL